MHAPPPQPSIFGSIERFVVKGAAPNIPSDAQPEVPDSEDAILLPLLLIGTPLCVVVTCLKVTNNSR